MCACLLLLGELGRSFIACNFQLVAEADRMRIGCTKDPSWAQMFGVRISSLVKGKDMLPGMSKMRTGEGVTYKVRLRTVAMELVKRGWLTSADVFGVVRA